MSPSPESPIPPESAVPLRMRSILFAPGNRAEVLAKLPRSAPDVAVIDLEDAVPDAAKAEARAIAAAAVGSLVDASPTMSVWIRVNAVVSEHFAADVVALPAGLVAVVVPKLESVAQVAKVRDALADRYGPARCPAIVAGLETAAGVEGAAAVLGCDEVRGGYFGAEDFIADMGGVRTAGNGEVAYARARVALAGRLASTPVADQIVADFGDEERFAREAAEAAAMGFAGKLCIHPAQVALARSAFVPGEAEVARARALLDAYERAVAEGSASIAFEGQMVDEPVARQARNLIARAE